jgi:hypothetical protein
MLMGYMLSGIFDHLIKSSKSYSSTTVLHK